MKPEKGQVWQHKKTGEKRTIDSVKPMLSRNRHARNSQYDVGYYRNGGTKARYVMQWWWENWAADAWVVS